MPKDKITILIIVAVILIIAAGAGFWLMKVGGERSEGNEKGVMDAFKDKVGEWGQKPGEKQEEFQGSGEIPEPPKGEVSVYKGFWMPCSFYYDHDCQTMSDPKDLKAAGANIASIAPNVKINAKGEAKFEAPFDYVEQSLNYWAKKYYENGIRISLVIEVAYEEEFSERSSGEPQPIPRDIASQKGFLTEYNKIVIKVAQLVEKYQVEMFSPMNEPDLKLGEATASFWGQAILPEVEKYYHGKTLWKAAGGALDRYDTNFKGYDIIGFDPTPGGGEFELSMATYRQTLNNLLNAAQNRAKRDNVPEIMITEFGVWGGAVKFNEEQKAIAHRVVFEQGQGKVSGFIVLDPPPDLDRGLKRTKTLEEITKWFKKL